MAVDESFSVRMEMYRSAEELAEDPDAHRLREAIVRSEELADRFDDQMQWDAAVFRALHDVEVPSGLADRLLAGVRESFAHGPEAKLERGRGRGGWRRSWIAATVAAAVVAVVLPTLWWIPWKTDVAAWSVGDWLRETRRAAISGNRAMRRPTRRTLSDFPVDPGLRLTPRLVTRLRIGGRPAVLYEGTDPDGRRWMLAVVRVRERLAVPALPPRLPVQASSGWCGAVWQNGKFVFVLHLRGTPADYRAIIESGMPLA